MVSAIPLFTNTEKIIKRYSILFTLIVMYQGLFGGMSLSHKPKVLEDMKTNIVFKYATLLCIAFSATKDIEISMLSLLVFILVLNLLRTPEERKKFKFYEI